MAIHLLWQVLQNNLRVLFFFIFHLCLSGGIHSIINVAKVIDVCAVYVFVCEWLLFTYLIFPLKPDILEQFFL